MEPTVDLSAAWPMLFLALSLLLLLLLLLFPVFVLVSCVLLFFKVDAVRHAQSGEYRG